MNIKICDIFIECTEIRWDKRDANGLCVSIFIKDMVRYLGDIGKLHNEECIIYIFTGKVIYGNPKIFTN